MIVKLHLRSATQFRLFSQFCASVAENALIIQNEQRAAQRVMFGDDDLPEPEPVTVSASAAPEQEVQVDAQADAQVEPSSQTVAQRERGKPSAGRKRRTAEEIAEDEAAERGTDGLTAGMHKSDLPQISTGENHVDPEDTPEVQAQDKADERAESDASTQGTPTLDDVREAAAAYAETYGIAVAQKDVPAILGSQIASVAAEKAGEAAAVLRRAIDDNPYDRAAVSGTVEQPVKPTATKEELIEVMQAYVAKHGGEAAEVNGAAIFGEALGPVPAGTKNAKGVVVDKWVLSAVPASPEAYGAAKAAWEAKL